MRSTSQPTGNITELKSDVTSIPQYSPGKILLIWAAAAIPMGILGWVVAPAQSTGFGFDLALAKPLADAGIACEKLTIRPSLLRLLRA
jgi:hypothetical protein